MFRDLEKSRPSSRGIAAHRIFGVNMRVEGQTANRRSRDGRRAATFACSVSPGRRPVARPARRPGDRSVAPSWCSAMTTGVTRSPRPRRSLGGTIVVNGQPMTVVGVAPRGFAGTTMGSRPQIFVPITMRGAMEPPFAASITAKLLGVPVRAIEAGRLDRRSARAASISHTSDRQQRRSRRFRAA